MSRNRGVTKAHVERRNRLAAWMRVNTKGRSFSARHIAENARFFAACDGYHSLYQGDGCYEQCERDLKNLEKQGIVESRLSIPRYWKIVEGE